MFLPGGKSLPPPLQVKLGKKVCVSFIFGFISLSFLFYSFFFCLWQEEVGGRGRVHAVPWPDPPLSPLTSRQCRTGALLCFNLLLYSVVGVWRRSVSARTSQDPSWGSAALGQSGSHVTAPDSASQSLFIRRGRGRGVIKNASYSGPENCSLLPERSHFFPVLFVPLLTQQTTRPSCCDRGPPCATTPQLNHLTTMAHIYQQRAADISQEDRKIVH